MAEVVWAKNRGRNGWDPIIDVGLDRSVDTTNLHLHNGGLGTKRGGATAVTTTGVTQPINALFEFIPGQDITAAELYAVDSSSPNKIFRCAGGSSFASLTLPENVSSDPTKVNAVALNGKLYIAYHSGVNRIHLFESAYSTTALRRGGLATAGTPSAADTGVGSYAAVARSYRTRWAEYRSGVKVREGEPGPIISFTPSGSGTAARVTRPSTISEGETNWILEASTDGITFYQIATVVAATSTYDDSLATTAYATGTLAPAAGSRTPFPSVKFLATDGNRLLGFGTWETSAGDSLAPHNGRVYYTAPLDSTDIFDDERINNTTTFKGYLDVARNSGAEDRGITPRPVNNVFYAFQSTGVYVIVPSSSPTNPFILQVMDYSIGCVSQQSIVNAVDRFGRPCAYFLDPVKGPYVVGGGDGLKWCGKDVYDLWATWARLTPTPPAWGCWFSDLNQVWFNIGATGQQVILVLDVTKMFVDEDGDLRGGWVQYTGTLALNACGCMFSKTLSSTRSALRVPYIGNTNQNALGFYDDSNGNTDFGAACVSAITSGAISVATHALRVGRTYLFAQPGGSISNAPVIQQKLYTNDAATPFFTSQVNLGAAGLMVLKKFEDATAEDAWLLQTVLNDNTGGSTGFTLNRWVGDIDEGSAL